MQKQQITITYNRIDRLSDLPAADLELVQLAIDNLKNAYAPYSKFYVSSALRLENGEIIKGTNQENASYPLCLCGERVAIFAAQANFPDQLIKSVAITARTEEGAIAKAVAPCGACRQTLLEVSRRQNHPIRLILNNGGEKSVIMEDARELLPLSFHAGFLIME